MPMWGYGWGGGFGWLFPLLGLVVMVLMVSACLRMTGRHAGPSASEIEELRREIRELREEVRQLRADGGLDAIKFAWRVPVGQQHVLSIMYDVRVQSAPADQRVRASSTD